MIRLRIWLGLVVAIAATGAAVPQGPPQTTRERTTSPSFGVTVPTVFVDVIVTHRRDKHVLDLRPEEFELFEDRVKQAIDSVEVPIQALRPVAEGRERTGLAATTVKAATAEAGSRMNVITFLLDYSTTEFPNQRFVREAAVKYLKEKIGPNDWIAVYALGSSSLLALQHFTNDKNLLAASLSKVDPSGTAHSGERALLDSEILRERQLGSSASAFSTTQGGGADNVPGAPLLSGSGPFSDRLRAILGQRIDNNFTALRSFTDSMLARPVLAAIKSIALAQRDLAGRKTLILFSSGFVVPPNVEDLMRDAVDSANKANLAIYAIDTRGLEPKEASARGELDSINAAAAGNVRTVPGSSNPVNVGTAGGRASSSSGETLFDKARQVGSDQNESTLSFLSNSTGGFPIRNTNDLGLGLARIDEDVRNYYLLSYRPTNLNFDGKFREIRVEVNCPGVKVRARSGYYAIPPSDALLTPDQRSLFAAAREKTTEPTLPMFTSTDQFFPGSNSSATVVTLEVPIDSLELKDGGPFLEDTLQITGLVSDRRGTPITAFGQPLPLRFDKSQLDAIRGGLVSHSALVKLGAGEYFLEALVYEPSTRKFGYHFKELALVLPKDFKLSNLVLSRQVLRATPEVKSDPLVTGEVKIVPSASRQFRNGDQLVFYFDIYNAKVKDSRSDVEVTLSMKKDGKPFAVKLPSYTIDEAMQAERFRIQVAKYLELAGLPAGNYSLIVSARDRTSGSTSSSEASFTVVPD